MEDMTVVGHEFCGEEVVSEDIEGSDIGMYWVDSEDDSEGSSSEGAATTEGTKLESTIQKLRGRVVNCH